MAETKSTTNTKEEKGLSRQSSTLARRSGTLTSPASPFQMMDRMMDEMDRWFDDFTRMAGFPSLLSRRPFGLSRPREGVWWPRIETGQKGNRFFVRADLPGLTRDDINVHVSDDAITIRGERKAEREEEQTGLWRSEREYGEFHRVIPLPEGVIPESANATFRNGVLEISMEAAPEEANRGRRIEIQEASTEQKK